MSVTISLHIRCASQFQDLSPTHSMPPLPGSPAIDVEEFRGRIISCSIALTAGTKRLAMALEDGLPTASSKSPIQAQPLKNATASNSCGLSISLTKESIELNASSNQLRETRHGIQHPFSGNRGAVVPLRESS